MRSKPEVVKCGVCSENSRDLVQLSRTGVGVQNGDESRHVGPTPWGEGLEF